MTPITRDERTVATENASYRLGFNVLSYGLLLSTMYRGLVRNEAAWDLLALVIVGGGIATLYQASYRVLTRQWAFAAAAAMALAAIVGLVIVLVMR